MNPTMYPQPMPQYAQHLAMLEQQRSQYQAGAQPIQTIKSIQQQAQCYFVKSPDEMAQIQIMPNTLYMGINSTTQEIYTRQMTNDGNIAVDTYVKADGKQEQPEWKMILARLENIETKLNGGKNEPNDVATNNVPNAVGPVEQPPVNGNV